jgi:hypothetical protein
MKGGIYAVIAMEVVGWGLGTFKKRGKTSAH